MSKATLRLGRMLATTLLVMGTVRVEAGTTQRAKVSGVTRGSTVSVEATVQCPQGQNECSAPQGASGIVEITWPNSSAKYETQQLNIKSPRDSARRWELRGAIKIEGDLPEGKTASGDFALVLNEDYVIENLKVTVKK